jgi:hypothetical protein
MKIAAPEPGISRLVARMVWRTEGFEPRTLRVTYSARHPVIEISSRRRSSPRLTPVTGSWEPSAPLPKAF